MILHKTFKKKPFNISILTGINVNPNLYQCKFDLRKVYNSKSNLSMKNKLTAAGGCRAGAGYILTSVARYYPGDQSNR